MFHVKQQRNDTVFCVTDNVIHMTEDELDCLYDKHGQISNCVTDDTLRQIDNHNEVYKKLCLQK